MRTVKGIGRAAHSLLEVAASSQVRKTHADCGVTACRTGFFPGVLGKPRLCLPWAASLTGQQGWALLALRHLPRAITHRVLHPRPPLLSPKTRRVHCCNGGSSSTAPDGCGFYPSGSVLSQHGVDSSKPARPTRPSCDTWCPRSCLAKFPISDAWRGLEVLPAGPRRSWTSEESWHGQEGTVA